MKSPVLIVNRDDHQALAAAAIRLLNDNEFALKLVRNAHESTQEIHLALHT